MEENTLDKLLPFLEKKDHEKTFHVSCHVRFGCSFFSTLIIIHDRGGSRIPQRRGALTIQGVQTYGFAKFSKKLHETEKFLGRRGRACRRCPTPADMKMHGLKFNWRPWVEVLSPYCLRIPGSVTDLLRFVLLLDGSAIAMNCWTYMRWRWTGVGGN